MAMKGEKTVQDESFVSICLTDAEKEHGGSTYSTNLPYEGCTLRAASDAEKAGVQELCRISCNSDCADDSDLECGLKDVKVFVEKFQKDCRICSISFSSFGLELGNPILLGCSCKGDLAFAHQKCADTWFNIKGNKNCEICGSKVMNLARLGVMESTENTVESSNNTAREAQTQRFCQGHRLLGSIIGIILVVIIICWLLQNSKKNSEIRLE